MLSLSLFVEFVHRITTAVASHVTSMTSPALDGFHPLHAWITPITAIQLLDTLPLLSASTTVLSHWLKSFNSKLHPENCHYALIYLFVGTSTKRSMVSPMDVRMVTLKGTIYGIHCIPSISHDI
jgi:hypothetical protein